MSIQQYRIDRFFGINQSVEENYLPSGYTHFAKNMCTDDGNLAVAKGYTKLVSCSVPDSRDIHRMVLFRHGVGDIYIAFCGDSIYCGDGTAWTLGYTYPTPLSQHDFDVVEANIGSVDYLLIGNGETQLIKYDGTTFSTFGSSESNSNHPVRYLSMYRNRLFCAGDPNYPNRLYWSKLPGDTRSIEDWGSDEASANVEGGHIEVGLFDNDPIVAVTALSNQLLIFKKYSMYRLYGDKPSNFTLEQVEAVIDTVSHRSIIHYGDVAYFLTPSGMCVFDGVSAHICDDARYISDILINSDTTGSIGAMTRDKLYFSLIYNGNDALIEYDMLRNTYMLRDGFGITDMFAKDNQICLINDARYIYLFNSGTTYDGTAIHALWNTPHTDGGAKTVIKQLRELYFRIDKENRGVLLVTTEAGGKRKTKRVALFDDEITEVPIFNEGRCFSLTFENEAGSSFLLRGGIEMSMGMRERCI